MPVLDTPNADIQLWKKMEKEKKKKERKEKRRKGEGEKTRRFQDTKNRL